MTIATTTTTSNVVTFGNISGKRHRRCLSFRCPRISYCVCALVLFVALSFANFLVSFVRSVVRENPVNPNPYSVENVILLGTILASGLVINIGTILQILSQFRGKNTAVNVKYTQCLVAGCLVLFVGQVHSSMNDVLQYGGNINWAANIATPITTLISFVCSSLFYLVNSRMSGRSSSAHIETPNDSREILCEERSLDSVVDEEHGCFPADSLQQQHDQQHQLHPQQAYRVSQQSSHQRRRRRHLIFVEGTACIGKTTLSDMTFDFSHYLQLYDGYARKNDLLYIQSLYEANLYADTLYAMINENLVDQPHNLRSASFSSSNGSQTAAAATSPTTTTSYYELMGEENERRRDKKRTSLSSSHNYYKMCKRNYFKHQITLFDRSPFSQIAYAILYELDGPSCEPHIFAERVDEIFADQAFVSELTNVFRKWVALFAQLYPNVDVRVYWFGALSPSATVELLVKRDSMEMQQPGWNLLYYIHNQNKIFKTIQAKTGFGVYRETKFLNRSDLMNEILYTDESRVNKITTV